MLSQYIPDRAGSRRGGGERAQARGKRDTCSVIRPSGAMAMNVRSRLVLGVII